jgi:hypothetical protein
MLLDAGILALLVGAVVGRGRLSRVRDLDLRAPAVFVFAALAKIAVAILGWRGVTVGILVGGPVNVLAYLLLLVGLFLNRHLWGMRVAAVGVLLNFLVIAANGGSMPVDRDLAVRAGNRTLVQLLDSPAYVSHKPIHAGTRLRPLADVLPLPLLFPRPRFFAPGSIGDVVVTFGACWLILSALGAFGLGRRGPSGEAERSQGEAAL